MHVDPGSNTAWSHICPWVEVEMTFIEKRPLLLTVPIGSRIVRIVRIAGPKIKTTDLLGL